MKKVVDNPEPDHIGTCVRIRTLESVVIDLAARIKALEEAP